MERYLIDTTVFLAWLNNRKKLSSRVYEILADPQSEIYISAASIWEIDLKRGLGEVSLENVDISAVIEESGFHKVDISSKSAKVAKTLPSTQQDPFNRTIIAQAMNKQLTLITMDKSIKATEELKVLSNN